MGNNSRYGLFLSKKILKNQNEALKTSPMNFLISYSIPLEHGWLEALVIMGEGKAIYDQLVSRFPIFDQLASHCAIINWSVYDKLMTIFFLLFVGQNGIIIILRRLVGHFADQVYSRLTNFFTI